MKRIIPFFLIIFFAAGVFAQVGTLTVTKVASTKGTGVTVVDYEFSGPDGAYDISAKVDFGDGDGFLAIDNADIVGNLTNVEPGNHSLTWNGGISFPDRYHENTVLELSATQVCGENVSVTFTYNGAEVTYGTVWRNGLCWLDRNLGADPMPFVPADDATGNTDTRLYGDLFQWGRADEGHQLRGNTVHHSGLATTREPNTGGAWDGKFITLGSPGDWLETQNDDLWQGVDGANNPCPPGWRVPTEAELNAERLSWGTGNQNSAGAYASTLKWPIGGQRRNFGPLDFVGSRGLVWSSSVSGANAGRLFFDSGDAYVSETSGRILGMSVRCVRD